MIMDKLTPAQRRKNMQAVRSSGSRIEILLGKAMWAVGIRYRKNNRKIFGNPDFTLCKYKIAVFCDSEFWHGKDWETRKNDIHTNKDFWINKIEANIKRDRLVSETLCNEGWQVIRFWGNDIIKNPQSCAETVKNAILERTTYFRL